MNRSIDAPPLHIKTKIMKYFLTILSCFLALNIFSQEEVNNQYDLRDEIEHLEELIFKQAMQIDELKAGSLTTQLASNQTAYSKSVLQSTTLGFGSGLLMLGGLSAGQELAMVAGAGGALAAVVIRISGIVQFYKNTRFQSRTGSTVVKSRITSSVKSKNTTARSRSTFKKGQMVQVELKDDYWVSGVVQETTEWKTDEFRYRVSYREAGGKKKSKFFSEKHLRSPK